MKIEKIEIKGLFGKKDICWELNPQVNVLVGENGSGKSTILLILANMLSHYEIKKEYANLFDITKLFFQEGYLETISHDEFLKDLLLSNPKIGQEIQNMLPYKSIMSFGNEHLSQKAWDNIYLDLIEANTSNVHANMIWMLRTRSDNNPLDIEIQDTIDGLNKLNNPELINRLSGSLNFFFNQIGKQVTYENNEWIYTDTQLQKTLNYSDLSSGERQLIYILLRVALSNGDKSKTAIILMDEPEISLHLNWQAHFIKQLTILNPDAQFIIVTHSPALIMNGWNDVYVNMKDITQ